MFPQLIAVRCFISTDIAKSSAKKTNEKTGLVLPASVDARKAIESMNDDLRALYLDLRKKLSAQAVNDIIARWEIGNTVSKVTTGNHEEKYGSKALETLAVAFGCGTGVLYAAHTFARAFEKEELAEITKRRNIVARPISYSDLLEVAKLKKKTDKNKLLTYFFKNDVGWRQLRVRAQELVGSDAATASQGGAKGIVPRNPLAGLRAVSRHAEKFNKVASAISSALIPQLSEFDGKKSEKLLQELVDAEQSLSDLKTTVDTELEVVSKALRDISNAQVDEHNDDAAEQPEVEARPRKKIKKPKPLVQTVAPSGRRVKVRRVVKPKQQTAETVIEDDDDEAIVVSAKPAAAPVITEEDELFAV